METTHVIGTAFIATKWLYTCEIMAWPEIIVVQKPRLLDTLNIR